MFENIVERYHLRRKAKPSYNDLLQQGREARDHGDWRTAENCFQRAWRKAPTPDEQLVVYGAAVEMGEKRAGELWGQNQAALAAARTQLGL